MQMEESNIRGNRCIAKKEAFDKLSLGKKVIGSKWVFKVNEMQKGKCSDTK